MTPDLVNPAATTCVGGGAVPPALIAQAARLPTSTLHEAAGRIGALPAAIKPVGSGMRLCGRAVTVHSPAADNLWLHRAIYAAEAGDVLVVTVDGAHEYGYWGEIMSTAAKVRGLAGMVINGCVRDGVLLAEIGFPVFARGLSIRGTGKDFGARGWINAPVSLDGTTVRAGDLIAGDADGLVCLPPTSLAGTLEVAQAREAFEAEVLRRLKAGETTLAVYGWDVSG